MAQDDTYGGTLQVTPLAAFYGPSTTYTIFDATGGRTGTFSGLTLTASPLLTATLSYDANDAFLTLTRQSFASILTVPNSVAIANALVTAATAGQLTGQLASTYANFFIQTPAAIEAQLESMSNEDKAEMINATLSATTQQNFLLADVLRSQVFAGREDQEERREEPRKPARTAAASASVPITPAPASPAAAVPAPGAGSALTGAPGSTSAAATVAPAAKAGKPVKLAGKTKKHKKGKPPVKHAPPSFEDDFKAAHPGIGVQAVPLKLSTAPFSGMWAPGQFSVSSMLNAPGTSGQAGGWKDVGDVWATAFETFIEQNSAPGAFGATANGGGFLMGDTWHVRRLPHGSPRGRPRQDPVGGGTPARGAPAPPCGSTARPRATPRAPVSCSVRLPGRRAP